MTSRPESDYKSLLSRAFVDAQARRFELAQTLCQAAIDLAPERAEGWTLRAAIALSAGDAAQSFEAGRHAVALAPAQPRAQHRLAHALRATGQLDLAIMAFRCLTEIEPDSEHAWRYLGLLLAQQGSAAAAVAAISQMLRLAPRSWRAPYTIGVLLKKGGAWAEATIAFEAAVTASSGNWACQSALGEVLTERRLWVQAITPLDRATTLNPRSATARYQLSLALSHSDRLAEAASAGAAALALTPSAAAYHHHLGRILFELDRRRDARSFYLNAAAFDPAANWLPPGWQEAPHVLATIEAPRAYAASRGLDYRIIAPASQVDLRTDSSAYPHLHYALPETFAIRLTDVTLIPTHFSVVTSDHAVLLDGLHYGGRLDRFVTNYFAYVSADNRVLALLPNKAQIHDEPAVLLGGDLNFAHCLLDSFSRLSVIEAMPELASRRLVVSTSMRPSVAEALKLMGWDDQKLIRVDPAECHRFRDLWVPSFTHAMFRRPAPVHLAFLRRRLFSQAEQRDPRTARRRFLLSRGGAPHRRALNEDEIMTALAPLGFERISTETMTMAQRIELLAQAEVVVGLAGAGMANVVALPRSTVVIEVTHQHWVEQHFLALSRMLDHLHRFVVGRAAVKPGVPLQHCDYTVESGRIVNAVNDLMKDRRARLSSWRPLAPND